MHQKIDGTLFGGGFGRVEDIRHRDTWFLGLRIRQVIPQEMRGQPGSHTAEIRRRTRPDT